MAYLCVNTPHIDVYVKKEYLYDGKKGHGELVEGVWVNASQFKAEHYTLKLTYLSMVPCMTSCLLVRLYGKKIMKEI